jgi:signal transduction histidine kinase
MRRGFRLPGHLSWRQWLVLFSMGAAVIVIEVHNHLTMWEEHQSGQTVGTDPELIGEIFLFGLVFPILAGLVLSYMTRTAVERDQIARELDLRRQLVTQMQNARSRQELADVIVTLPGNTTFADRAWLLAQPTGEDDFEQIARWERPGSDLIPVSPPVTPAVCEHCERAASLTETGIIPCHHLEPGADSSPHTRYCLWLTSENTGKATLLFETSSEHRPGMRELNVLNDLRDEILLAIENANLLQLKQRQTDAARDERLRIARNLHDTVGQNVSYLRFKIDQLRTSALTFEPVEFHDELAGTLTVADEVYEQLRDTLEELRTTEHQNLEQTIRQYAGQAADRAGISVQVHTIGNPVPFSPRKSRQVLYILREALNNVEKHSGAKNVDISLRYSEEEFALTVRDDGTGFRQGELGTEDCYGIAIMGERAQAISGDLAIESAPGKGTEVALHLPLIGMVAAASRTN